MSSVQAIAQGVGAFAATRNNQIRTLMAIREAKAKKRAAEVEATRNQQGDRLKQHKAELNVMKTLGHPDGSTLSPMEAAQVVAGTYSGQLVPFDRLDALAGKPLTSGMANAAEKFASGYQTKPYQTPGLVAPWLGLPPESVDPSTVPARHPDLQTVLDAFNKGRFPASPAGFEPVPEKPKAGSSYSVVLTGPDGTDVRGRITPGGQFVDITGQVVVPITQIANGSVNATAPYKLKTADENAMLVLARMMGLAGGASPPPVATPPGGGVRRFDANGNRIQ